MRWCVVIRALKTTTQLALPTLSISVSTIWGTFTLVWSWVAWIRSGKETSRVHKLIKQVDRWDGKTEAWRCKRGAASSGHCCTAPAFPAGRLGLNYSELLLSCRLPSQKYADRVFTFWCTSQGLQLVPAADHWYQQRERQKLFHGPGVNRNVEY